MHILKEILRSLKVKQNLDGALPPTIWLLNHDELPGDVIVHFDDDDIYGPSYIVALLARRTFPHKAKRVLPGSIFHTVYTMYCNHACTTHFWAMRCPHFVFWCTSPASMSQWVILGLVRRHALNRTPIMKASISVYACCRSCKVCAILRSLNDSSFVLWKTILYRPQWLLKLTVETWLIGPCWMRLGMQYSLTDTPCAHSFDLILNLGISG